MRQPTDPHSTFARGLSGVAPVQGAPQLRLVAKAYGPSLYNGDSSSSSIHWHSNLVSSADYLRMLAHVWQEMHTHLDTEYFTQVNRDVARALHDTVFWSEAKTAEPVAITKLRPILKDPDVAKILAGEQLGTLAETDIAMKRAHSDPGPCHTGWQGNIVIIQRQYVETPHVEQAYAGQHASTYRDTHL